MNTKKDTYTYEAPWLIYSMNWSVRPDYPFRLALSSFLFQFENRVHVIQLNDEKGEFEVTAEINHPYPPTNLKWIHDKIGTRLDLMATTADHLRIWQIGEDGKVRLRCLFNKQENTKYNGPLTSFDWNELNPELIGICSIDTTCTIWNIAREQTIAQMIAHDKEVYDIAFTTGDSNVFASVGADGSVRMFDLRSLQHSNILYETKTEKPLLRLTWNRQNSNYLATFQMNDNKVIVLDLRLPMVPITELAGHTSSVNSISWAPHSTYHMCTAGDDKQTLVWDLRHFSKQTTDPILAYYTQKEVNTSHWSSAQPYWISVAYGKRLQILHV